MRKVTTENPRGLSHYTLRIEHYTNARGLFSGDMGKDRPASAVGSVHAEPNLNRWAPSPEVLASLLVLGPAIPNGRRIPSHVVLAHVDWNLTHSAGLPSAYPCAKENASITRQPVSCVTWDVSCRLCH